MILDIQHAKAKSEQRLQQQQRQQQQRLRTLVVEEKLPGKCHAHNLLKDSLENVGQTTSAGEIYLHLSLSWKIAKLNCQTVQSMGSWEIGGKFASKLEKVRAIDEEESIIIPLQLARQAQRTSALDN